MAGNEVIRQHYVPQTYLKRFGTEVNENSRVKAIPINELQIGKIFETSTANICLKKNLYTLPGNTVEERMLIERFYAENYEAKYSQAYELLVDPQKTTLTNVERELIISTVVTMLYRTTKWINLHNELMCRVLERGYELAHSIGKDYILFEKEKISISGKSLKQLQDQFKTENQPGQVTTQLHVALSLLKLRLDRDGIQVGKLAEGDEFITSDNPVLYYQPNGERTMPFDPSNILELPLDSKHVLMLMPFADDEIGKLHISRLTYPTGVSLTQKMTSNHIQLENAEQFLIGSEAALTNFIGTKEALEQTLSEEEIKQIGSLEDIINKLIDNGIK